MREKTPKRRASSVFIEISGTCNARCPYCAQRRLRKAKQFGGIMSPELFELTLDRLFALQILEAGAPSLVNLFNWGEPLLNPGINAILRIVRRKGLYAGISSNLIARPDLDKDVLPAIKSLTFSLSGFDQQSYGRIHGARLDKVLENFEALYAQIRRSSPETAVTVAWHRYVFNEGQFWDAYRYFARPGINFSPSVAYLNDFPELLDFSRGNLPQDRRADAEKDVFLDHMRRGLAYCKARSAGFHCPAWDFVVIDETGQLLLCCGPTRYDADYVLGKVSEMSAAEIGERKRGHPVCGECVSSGLALWAYRQDLSSNNKPWPPGGGLDRVKARYKASIRPGLITLARKLPKGDAVMKLIRRLRPSC